VLKPIGYDGRIFVPIRAIGGTLEYPAETILKFLKSSRRELIISIPDLSHHRTYRSVYGGSNRN